MIRGLAVFMMVNITLMRCSETKIPKTGIFLFLTEEGEHCFSMLSVTARKAFRTVREIKNSQMRTGNFSAFDFHRNLYKISPEAALCYLEMSYSIDDRVNKMDGEAADFVRLMKAIYIDGPWSAYERLSRVTEVPHALKSLSDTARSQIYKAFPNFKTLSNAEPGPYLPYFPYISSGNPRDQSARLMREIYSNRG